MGEGKGTCDAGQGRVMHTCLGWQFWMMKMQHKEPEQRERERNLAALMRERDA